MLFQSILFLASTAPAVVPAAPVSIDLNAFLSGSGGVAVAGGLVYVFKLIADRRIPSRSDTRANSSQVMEGLGKVIEVLQSEKEADAQRLKDKQDRIDDLEASANQDYDRITDLRNEVLDLRNRLAQKERHIRILVLELRKLGARVSGIDVGDESTDIEVTLSPDQIRELREQA